MNIAVPAWLKCSKCAFFEAYQNEQNLYIRADSWANGLCHFTPEGIPVSKNWWCRQFIHPHGVVFPSIPVDLTEMFGEVKT